jgi:hypothetical protein
MVTPASNSKLRTVLKDRRPHIAENRRNDTIMAPRDHYWLGIANLNPTLHPLRAFERNLSRWGQIKPIGGLIRKWNFEVAETFTHGRYHAASRRIPNETIIADRRRSLCIRGHADPIRFCNAAGYCGLDDHEF